MFRRSAPNAGDIDKPPTVTPEEEAAYEAGLDRVAEEKRQALLDPGPGWKEWFLHDGAKWWMGLLFLIVDSWIVASWFPEFGPFVLWAGLTFGSLAAAVYLEYLAYSYLWHRPHAGQGGRLHGREFRPTWIRPFPYGRWTPEGDRIRAGHPLANPASESGPDARDFL